MSPSDDAPPMRDCAETYRIGATAPGRYHLDTSGQERPTDDLEAYCEDGWTYILVRDPESNLHGDIDDIGKDVSALFAFRLSRQHLGLK